MTGSYQKSITAYEGSGGNNWNLVENAYLSSIYANTNAHATNNFLSVNTAGLHDDYEALYVWNAATAQYDEINNATPAAYIPPGQAFFVYSADAGATLGFNTTMRAHQPDAVFKNGTIANPHIKLLAQSAGKTADTDIYYIEGTGTGLDPGYDAGCFGLASHSFSIYTKLVDGSTTNFAIQSLPPQN